MDPRLDRKFPSVGDIERQAVKRLPKFIREYIRYGMGQGGSVKHNRNALDAVKLLPRYLVTTDDISFETELFGKKYAAPFGIAPVGLGGFSWPKSAEILAHSARIHKIPFTASTFALASLETLRERAGEFCWFQLYRPNEETIESDLLARAASAGYEVLILTVDIPAVMRRDHDIRNGFSIPPQLSLQTLYQVITHPAWTMAMAKSGIPKFETLNPYVPPGLGPIETLNHFADMTTGHTTPEIIRRLRDKWKGTLVIKGILDVNEALMCRDLGVDGIIVSNHGGRQLEAAPSPCDVLGNIRENVGENFTLIADGGVRTGLDICRMISLGADFVMMGRPFYYAITAMGENGADHIIELFKAELECVMGQLGCPTLDTLKDHLFEHNTG